MNIVDTVTKITDILNGFKLPANTLPPLLLRAISETKPGLSAYKIATEIIQNNQVLGISTKENPDGSDNKINQFVYNIVKSVVKAIKDDASVQVVLPSNSILVQATGGNAGGPVTCIGTNIMDAVGKGIIQ